MSENNGDKKELVIIGGGPGGYRAAFMAADLGLDVTLIDPEENPGGECLYRGCIPTKALLHLVKVKHSAVRADSTGIYFEPPRIELEEITRWKDSVVKKLTGGLGQLVKARKINYIQGTARFLDPRTLEVETVSGKHRKISFRKAIIATGAKVRDLPEVRINGKEIMGSEEALELKELPGRLLIVGGGYIGLEMAAIYQGLGSEVSVTELTDGFMPGMDRDLVSEFNRMSKHLFKDVFLETSVKKVKKTNKTLQVTFKEEGGREFSHEYDKILVAVGEKPDHSSLGLENTEVETDEKGFIRVDEKQRSADEGILAIGDVTGTPLLAHRAMYQGRIAAEVAAGKDVVADAKVIPSVVYTEPEIAVCGLTENEAKEKGQPYKKVKFPWSASGRALAMNEKRGFTKLLVDPNNGRILGAGIVGKDAGELIAEVALAVEMGANATDLSLTVHPHPTLSETIMETAELFLGHPAHTMSKKSRSG
ncbi:MAG: dihydrolipoyl dehydrogenase [Bacteroidales bacterium]